MTRLIVLLILCASVAAPSRDAAAAPRRRVKEPDAAAQAFAQGSRLFKQMDYQQAAEAFQRSYRLKPHFLTLCNMARCHARMNDMVQAAETYRRCLREGGRESNMAARFAADLAKVETRITTLVVNSAGEGGIVHVNGRAVGAAPQSVPLNPGTHVIEVRREGATPASTTVDARGGQSSVVLSPADLPPREPPPARPPPPKKKKKEARRSGLSSTWFWTGAGVTVALAVASTVMSVLTLRANQDFDEAPTWERYHRVINYRLVTNILWGATAAVGATTTVLVFFTDFRWARDRGQAALGVGIAGSF